VNQPGDRVIHPATKKPIQIQAVPIMSLGVGESPRLNGQNKAHIARLAGTDAPLPPILVDRRTMRAGGKFQRTYAGEPGQVRQVREDIGWVFGWCPMAEELVLHSKSGNGGQFTVTVRVRYGDYAWIDVEDQGGKPARRGPDGPQAAHNSDSSLGKGLAIVDALAGEGNWGLVSLARTRPSDSRLYPEENAPEHVAWARIPNPRSFRVRSSRLGLTWVNRSPVEGLG
jgi:hypothetical protein